MRAVLSVLFSLAAVLALVMVTIYLTKLLMKKFNIRGGMGTGSGIDILSCRGIGPDKMIMAVRAGEKRLLLGVTSAEIKVLAELSEEDENSIRSADSQNIQGSFSEIFAKTFRKASGYDSTRPESDRGNNDKDGTL